MHEACAMVKRKPTPELDRLFRRVRTATKQPGSLKKLASTLGVTPPTLSDWLGGRFEPGGEVTLKLQKWVIGAEAKQQKERPGRAVTRPGPRPEKKKSHVEGKPSSGSP